MKRPAVIVVLVAAIVLAACGGSGNAKTVPTTVPDRASTTTTSLAANAIFPVHRITLTFVDHSRKTVDQVGTRSAPSRTLPTDVYVPTGAGPFPLIVHAHGSGGDSAKFSQLLGGWAKRGYVVAAPNFPLTNDITRQPSVIGDYVNQPADVRFVLDQLLQRAATTGNPLSGKIDTHHIGLSGLSLGGATVYGLMFNPCCREPRFSAVIVMSGIELPFGSTPYVYNSVPLLMMHGTTDPSIPYSSAVGLYPSLKPPKYFVSLLGALHAPPYENTPSRHDALVAQLTLDFWNAYLRHQPGAADRLVTDANQPGLSSIRFAR